MRNAVAMRGGWADNGDRLWNWNSSHAPYISRRSADNGIRREFPPTLRLHCPSSRMSRGNHSTTTAASCSRHSTRPNRPCPPRPFGACRHFSTRSRTIRRGCPRRAKTPRSALSARGEHQSREPRQGGADPPSSRCVRTREPSSSSRSTTTAASRIGCVCAARRSLAAGNVVRVVGCKLFWSRMRHLDRN